MPLEPGARLGPYEIRSFIGAGGMGEVYRALDPRLQREVAIKIVNPRLAENEEALEQFRREARAVALLSHPNVMAVYEFDTDGSTSFVVSELLEGENLRYRLGRGKLPWRRSVALAIDIAEGLAAAHGKGIVHRDLKPENVFLTTDGQVKILDFGLARPRRFSNLPVDESTPTERFERESDPIRGTVAYMAPELLRGEEADAPADLFALGCILFETLTGHRAFARATAVETMSAILSENVGEISEHAPDVPLMLKRIVTRSLAKNPAERFQAASDFAFALRSTLERRSLAYVRDSLRRPILIGAIAAMVIAGSVTSYVLTRDGDASVSPSAVRREIRSVAVLPFVNATHDPANDYLSDGITEALIDSLARLPNLGVTSRSSSFRYKNLQTNLRKIGRDLDVEALLTGRLLSTADQLVVSVELVDARNDRHLWGDRYAARHDDVLALQEQVARRISERLRLQLSGDATRALVKRHTQDPRAYRSYLLGRFEWNKRTPEAFARAITHFEEALAVDPQFALAYAGLADSFILQALYNVRPPREVLPKAREAALHALALDETLAEAHTSLAYYRMNYESDLDAAERSFRRAIELNPNYATAHQWYSRCLVSMKRYDEAVAAIRRAQELDPLSLVITAEAGGVYADANRLEEAIVECNRALELDPNFALARYVLAGAHLRRGDGAAAVREAETAWKLGGDPRSLVRIGHAFVRLGRTAEANGVLEQLVKLSRERFIPAFGVASLSAALGHEEKALQWIVRAEKEVPPGQLARSIREDPTLSQLGSKPAMAALLKRIERDTRI